MNAQPINTCTKEAIEKDNCHALVYGRCRIWYTKLSDNYEQTFNWSKWAWWKAMHYPHMWGPNHSGSWGIYAGDSSGFTGPGDAEITHWLPIPPMP